MRQERPIVSGGDDRGFRDTVAGLAEPNCCEQSVTEAPFANGILHRAAFCQEIPLGFTGAAIPHVGLAFGVEPPQVPQVAHPLSRGVGFFVGDGAIQFDHLEREPRG